MKSIKYFITQTRFNIKNAYALKKAFWIGVVGMMLNNVSFFAIWLLFMRATGPINGWTSMDVFGMIGVSMFCFGVTYGLFFGVVNLPELVLKGSFDGVMLSPVNSFLKLSGSSFLITAFGDLILGGAVFIFYGIYSGFGFMTWLLFISAIVMGVIVFICIRLLCSLVVFFIHDGEVVSTQLFEIFLRPGLYPGAVFPDKLKIFCMTIVPTLITSAIPIDVIKAKSFILLGTAILITAVWITITYMFYVISVKRYESGNLLR